MEILRENKSLQKVLDRAPLLHMPNWYVGAGGVAQTVWNVKHGFDPEYGIKDYDLVYFDALNISSEAQDAYIHRGRALFKDIPVPVEIVNEARVHLWYRKEFGYPTNQDQYQSVEGAIDVWPTTTVAVGVRKNNDGQFRIYAPFGLDDLFALIVRPNKAKITKEVYQKKIDRWAPVWPKLKIIPWEEEG